MKSLRAGAHKGDRHHEISYTCGVGSYARSDPDSLRVLAAFAGVDPAILLALSFGPEDAEGFTFRGVHVPRHMLPPSEMLSRRFCPGCLSEKPYHRAIWDIRYISACPVHLTKLVSHCGTCGRKLRFKNQSVMRCSCFLSADLGAVIADSIDEDDARGLKVVHGLLRDPRFAGDADEARSLYPLEDLQDWQIIDFLFRTGLEMLGPRKPAFSVRQLGDYAPDAHLAFVHGLQAAENWPDGFYHVIDTMRRR